MFCRRTSYLVDTTYVPVVRSKSSIVTRPPSKKKRRRHTTAQRCLVSCPRCGLSATPLKQRLKLTGCRNQLIIPGVIPVVVAVVASLDAKLNYGLGSTSRNTKVRIFCNNSQNGDGGVLCDVTTVVVAFCWLAWARRQLSGVLCWYICRS